MLRQRFAARKKPLIIGLVAAALVVVGVLWVQLRYGLSNFGQEFGTYGPYNRVLRVMRETGGYEVVNSQLTRKLDWQNLGHLERFSIRIRAGGRTATIEFVRGSPEMNERDPQLLREIIKTKFNAQVSPSLPLPSSRN